MIDKDELCDAKPVCGLPPHQLCQVKRHLRNLRRYHGPASLDIPLRVHPHLWCLPLRHPGRHAFSPVE